MGCLYDGIKLMNGDHGSTDINLQVGLYSSDDSKIVLDKTLFKAADSGTLFSTYTSDASLDSADDIATACAGTSTAAGMLDEIDKVIKQISTRTTTLGAAQNRIDSAIESIGVQSENITSSLSTLRDADISKESSNYIKAQILQQAAATLLSTANQSPSIALNLI